jgi:hypothetical protein
MTDAATHHGSGSAALLRWRRFLPLFLPLTILFIGIGLRFHDLMWPDMLSDEGLFVFPEVHSHPILVYWSFFIAKSLFGTTLLVARLTNVFLGLISLVFFFLIGKEYLSKKDALWVAAVASIVPYHILFSRVFELDIGVQLSWLIMMLAFIHARKRGATLWIILFFLACTAATFTKTQSSVLHGILLMFLLIRNRQRALRDTLFWVIILSLIPFVFYVLSHPGILATAKHITHNDPLLYPQKIIGLIQSAYNHQTLWVIAFLLALPALRFYGWPVTVLCIAGVCVPLLLGPNNEYYMSFYVFLAFPIGAAIARMRPVLKLGTGLFLVATTLFLIGSIPGYSRDWYQFVYRRPLYWNTHMDAINAALRKADVRTVTVLGGAGHQFRWYFEPEVRAGLKMNPQDMHGTIVITSLAERGIFPDATLLYEDEDLKIVQRK